MEEATQSRIKKCLPTLTRNMSVDCLLMAHLYQANVIDQKHYQKMKCYGADHERARYLLMDVILCGPQSKYEALLQTLKDVGQEHLVNILQGDVNTDSLPVGPDLSREDATMLTMEEMESIRRHYVQLIGGIEPHACFIAVLQQKYIIKDIQKQNIACMDTPQDKVRSILDIVLRGPKFKYTGFLHALRTSDMGHLADLIENQYEPMPCHEPCNSEVDWSLLMPLTDAERESVLDTLPLLVSSLSLTPTFFACLLQKNVIRPEQKNKLNTNARHSNVLHLMCKLLLGPRKHLVAFNEALESSKMGYLKIGARKDPRSTNALWDWSSPTGQQSLSLEKVDKMRNCLSTLTLSMTVMDSLWWAHLLHRRVVDTNTMEEIQGNFDKPDWMKVTDLLEYVWRQPAWKYHGFLKAATDCGYWHILSIIEEDPTPYRQPESTTIG